MMDQIKEMVEMRKDEIDLIQLQVRALERIGAFVQGLRDLGGAFDVDCDFPAAGVVLINIDLGGFGEETHTQTVVSGDVCIKANPDALRASLKNTVGDAPDQTVPEPKPQLKTGDWTDAEMQRLHDLDKQGLETSDIAVRLGRSAQSVGVKRHWLKKNAPTPKPASPKPATSIQDVTPVPTAPSAPKDGRSGSVGVPSSRSDRSTVPATKLGSRSGGLPRDFSSAEIEAHVRFVHAEADPFWDLEADLILVNALIRGDGAQGAVAELSDRDNAPTRGAVVVRWQTLCPQVTIANQSHLKAALERLIRERDDG
ncbi:hypothetical protein [Pacificibacter marinus]|uniref:hypothetical protein n=1 Tax=Pacificibacter marinus TaxID=658057 RepID=UPI001C07791F|nr:hypothetical protein [Pacificibacter marinus]MBU2867033.1 hypothetical protein [Pacificibacter marinus]